MPRPWTSHCGSAGAPPTGRRHPLPPLRRSRLHRFGGAIKFWGEGCARLHVSVAGAAPTPLLVPIGNTLSGCPDAKAPRRLGASAFPFLGVACGQPNSIACDRVGVGVNIARATLVIVEVAGRFVTLSPPTDAPNDHLWLGYLYGAGLRHGPLDVRISPHATRWFGSPGGATAGHRRRVLQRRNRRHADRPRVPARGLRLTHSRPSRTQPHSISTRTRSGSASAGDRACRSCTARISSRSRSRTSTRTAASRSRSNPTPCAASSSIERRGGYCFEHNLLLKAAAQIARRRGRPDAGAGSCRRPAGRDQAANPPRAQSSGRPRRVARGRGVRIGHPARADPVRTGRCTRAVRLAVSRGARRRRARAADGRGRGLDRPVRIHPRARSARSMSRPATGSRRPIRGRRSSPG